VRNKIEDVTFIPTFVMYCHSTECFSHRK